VGCRGECRIIPIVKRKRVQRCPPRRNELKVQESKLEVTLRQSEDARGLNRRNESRVRESKSKLTLPGSLRMTEFSKLWAIQMLCPTYGACSGCANTLIWRSSKALGNSHEFITLGAQLIDSMREHIVTCQKKRFSSRHGEKKGQIALRRGSCDEWLLENIREEAWAGLYHGFHG
jgi:hypothetical protein